MKEYVDAICNFFNNLCGYMEFEELNELLCILNYSLKYNVEEYYIREYLGDGWLKIFNDCIENDMGEEFYNELVKFLEEIKEED